MSVTIVIGGTEDAVAAVAALATKVIAAGGHPGHSVEEVGNRLTSDAVLDLIRTGYDRRIAEGATPKEAVIGVGESLIAQYCNSAGVPATGEETTADPSGAPHRTQGTCTATWRRVPVSSIRPELGNTTEYGHRACGEAATVDRFVKVAHGTYYRPVYACTAHARG